MLKLCKCGEKKEREHLVKWNNISNGNVIDAVTGATINSHGVRSTSWDFMNSNNELVIDGQYKLFVEFTEENSNDGSSPGKWMSLEFEKIDTSESIIPVDKDYFTNIELNYK